jgi:hypothetical protein
VPLAYAAGERCFYLDALLFADCCFFFWIHVVFSISLEIQTGASSARNARETYTNSKQVQLLSSAFVLFTPFLFHSREEVVKLSSHFNSPTALHPFICNGTAITMCACEVA